MSDSPPPGWNYSSRKATKYTGYLVVRVYDCHRKLTKEQKKFLKKYPESAPPARKKERKLMWGKLDSTCYKDGTIVVSLYPHYNDTTRVRDLHDGPLYRRACMIQYLDRISLAYGLCHTVYVEDWVWERYESIITSWAETREGEIRITS